MSLNDDQMVYWLFSNKNRIMLSIRVTGTVYESAYLGNYLRFAAAIDYPQPTLILGSHYSTGNFNDVGSTHNSIINPSNRNILYIDPNNTWRQDLHPNFTSVMPRQFNSLPAGVYTETTAGDKPLWPCYLFNSTDNWLMGQLEGVWYCN